mgnify:CR=1 FL=1
MNNVQQRLLDTLAAGYTLPSDIAQHVGLSTSQAHTELLNLAHIGLCETNMTKTQFFG